MAQSAEHILGKDEVVGSIPTISSSGESPHPNRMEDIFYAVFFCPAVRR